MFNDILNVDHELITRIKERIIQMGIAIDFCEYILSFEVQPIENVIENGVKTLKVIISI